MEIGEGMARRFIVKEIITETFPEYRKEYGVYEYVENTFIHTKDECANLIVLTYNLLIAEKICELLEVDEFIYINKENKGE